MATRVLQPTSATPAPPSGCVPVLELAECLAALPPRQFTPEDVYQSLLEHPVEPTSLDPYVRFDRQRYTRNLIYRTDRFELMAICWESGQQSTIHNHAGQRCWMMVPIGRLVNQNYRIVAIDPAGQTCQLEASTTCLIDPEHPLTVADEEPIHRVENRFEFGERAVSLHIYSLPYQSCIGYSLETGRYGEIPLRFDTMFGEDGPSA